VHRYTLDKQSRLENEHECVEQKIGEEEGKRHTLGQTDGRRGGWHVTGAGLDARSEQEISEVMPEEDRRRTGRLKPQ
jgi:hypothetical protein